MKINCGMPFGPELTAAGRIAECGIFLIILAALTIMPACQQPAQPPGETTTAIEEQSVLLTGAINTGCTLSKSYIIIDGYWQTIHPFIPANVLGNIVPIVNAYHAALQVYNDAVVLWSDTRKEPDDFAQLKQNLITINDSLIPLINQIIAAVNKANNAAAKDGAANISQAINNKGAFSCTIDELKALNIQLKTLPLLS
jgi:hypothetical protein